MQHAPQRRPRAPRAVPWLVLAAHLLALLLISQALRPRERASTPTPPRPLWLRLLPDEPARPGAEAPRPLPTRPAATAGPVPARPAHPQPAAAAAIPEAITLPAAEAPATANAPEPPASAPLDLRPPPALRHAPPPPAALARDDPRANTSRIGSEDRMARTLGTDLTLRESVTPDGTRYFRRGRDCVVARPAREGQLNPFNQSTRPTPRLVEKC